MDKMMLSEEIIEAVKAYGRAYSMPNTTASELTTRIQDIRALLSKYAPPQPQQIHEGYKSTKLNIGVSATTEGAAICIMKPNADGTVTVIYSGTHPLGDSLGSAMLEAAPEPKEPK